MSRRPKSYLTFAERAVELERQGEYRFASPLWYEAGLLASNKANQEYAKLRMAFCLKYAAIYTRPMDAELGE